MLMALGDIRAYRLDQAGPLPFSKEAAQRSGGLPTLFPEHLAAQIGQFRDGVAVLCRVAKSRSHDERACSRRNRF
jgi:hypothetical protein